jgi:N-acetylglutamate synthase
VRAQYAVNVTPADVGRRVSARSRIPAPARGGPTMTDTVGTLVSWHDGLLEIEVRDGSLRRLPETDLVAARLLPDRPPRRGG